MANLQENSGDDRNRKIKKLRLKKNDPKDEDFEGPWAMYEGE